MSQPVQALRKTPLNVWHRANGGRMAGFAGWDLPVEYAGLDDEHLAVRTRAGLFDVSHLGQVEVAGRDALAAVQSITCNDAGRLKVGETQRSVLTTPAGTFVDALVLYRLGSAHFLLVVDAAGVDKDVAWIVEQVKRFDDAAVVDTSARYAGVALQGPAAEDVLRELTDLDVRDLGPGGFTNGEVGGVRVTMSRTGCTGENGYELFAPPQAAVKLWTAILQAGQPAGVVAAGLGALDTLRLEAGFLAYGRDFDGTTSVLEAGLEEIVAWDKGEFVGRPALAGQRANGVTRRIVGFEMSGPGVARPGCEVYVEGVGAGTVTSGAATPFLKKAIGLAYVPAACAKPGTTFEVDVEGCRERARVVSLPFYHRPER